MTYSKQHYQLPDISRKLSQSNCDCIFKISNKNKSDKEFLEILKNVSIHVRF